MFKNIKLDISKAWLTFITIVVLGLVLLRSYSGSLGTSYTLMSCLLEKIKYGSANTTKKKNED